MLNYSVAELRFINYTFHFCILVRIIIQPHPFVPHALKGQKLLAQGIALGNDGRKPVAL